MQQRDQEEGVGGVAVQAAQYAACVPLLAREPVDGAINAVDRGVECGVKIQSGDGDNPETQETECAEMAPGVERGAEDQVETVLDALVGDKSPAHHARARLAARLRVHHSPRKNQMIQTRKVAPPAISRTIA